MSTDGKRQGDLLQAFGEPLAVAHHTNDTSATVIAGPIDIFQIQLDSPTATLSSLLVKDGTAATAFKSTYLNGIGTREITFIGRPLRFETALYVERPQGDTHIVDVTVIYRRL